MKKMKKQKNETDIIKQNQINNYRGQTILKNQQGKNTIVGSGNLVNPGQGQRQQKLSSSNQGKYINSGGGKNLNRGVRDYFRNFPSVGIRNSTGKPIGISEIPKTVTNNLRKFYPR